jgi:hypothetical protein
MGDHLYDDLLEWSEQQADLLRRLAAGERVNKQVDWPNLIEEVESVGRDQLRAVSSPLTQELLHTFKAQAWPGSREAPHLHAEARRFRGEAIDSYTPSMRQRLDLQKIYRRPLQAVPATIDGQPPLPLPSESPATLDELLAEEQ